MGVGALATIAQQDQATAILSNGFAQCQREIATLAINHAKQTQRLEQVANTLKAFKGQGFIDRVHWLLTGK